jgi:spore maturation protein SpmA
MLLNYIWIFFFLVAFVVALVKFVFLQDATVFPAMVEATFTMSKTGFEISLGLTGVMALWLGLMNIGEQGGAIQLLARFVSPIFCQLFPDIPKNHPASGAILMNISANLLGLDNAATPLGLKAMQELQTLNNNPERASNAQIMFLVLNTSGLTIIPISVMVYRNQMEAAQPSDIFLPILLATFFSTLAGLIAVAIYQKINLFSRTLLLALGGVSTLIGILIYGLSQMSQAAIEHFSTQSSNIILFGIIIGFISLGLKRNINVYEAFIEGAKESFQTAIRVIPYLIAILVAVGVFRACGAMQLLIDAISWLFQQVGWNTDFVAALPVAFMKPLSGSGARGLMVDTMQTYGADSFAGRLACIFQGSTDTTFYILAVYFGSVSIKHTRHAVTCGLIADFVGIIAAIALCYLFFG